MQQEKLRTNFSYIRAAEKKWQFCFMYLLTK